MKKGALLFSLLVGATSVAAGVVAAGLGGFFYMNSELANNTTAQTKQVLLQFSLVAGTFGILGSLLVFATLHCSTRRA